MNPERVADHTGLTHRQDRDSEPRRVLMVSPHFPPDTSAATHRVRLLAPHLAGYGWDPTVVTVDPRDYEGRLDDDLLGLVAPSLRVVRCRAWSPRQTRRMGIGDLGLRAFSGLFRACRTLLRERRWDVLFITTHPVYPAMLGPLLKARFGIPFVVDYQDPWIGAWGRSVGGGRNGTPDVKSRLSRAAARVLEPIVVRSTDGITAVSEGTYAQLVARYRDAYAKPWAELPVGGDPGDFEFLRAHPRPNRFFDRGDGDVHVGAVGTVLPMGRKTLEAVLTAVTLIRRRRPELYRRLRLHFFGTSNQTAADAAPRVLPLAQDLGIADRVTEIAPRIDYVDALAVHADASALLLMGSSEPHYTASKLYPALFARRPLLAVFHEASSVVGILRRVGPAAGVRLVVYDESAPVGSKVEEIASHLSGMLESGPCEAPGIDLEALKDVSAPALAGRLAEMFDRVTRR